jgi:hypothetical protein
LSSLINLLANAFSASKRSFDAAGASGRARTDPSFPDILHPFRYSADDTLR